MRRAVPKELRTERSRWDQMAREPYHAVLTDEVNRNDRLTPGARQSFLESGERDVAETLRDIRRSIRPDFRPCNAVDFGCGVGRLTIPLARVCDHITGIDISEAMLAEARRNCAAADVRNADFVDSAEYFAAAPDSGPPLDFVHSFIVLQHIPVRAGLWFTDALVRRLAPGGIGALHFTYARRAGRLRRTINLARRHLPGVNMLTNLAQRRPLSDAFIPMNRYRLGDVFTLLGSLGCPSIHARLTDHGGHLGAMLLFERT